jgi:hypothetical protein
MHVDLDFRTVGVMMDDEPAIIIITTDVLSFLVTDVLEFGVHVVEMMWFPPLFWRSPPVVMSSSGTLDPLHP